MNLAKHLANYRRDLKDAIEGFRWAMAVDPQIDYTDRIEALQWALERLEIHLAETNSEGD